MTSEDGELSHLLDRSGVLASDATLHSIVARSRHRRERRLKIVTTGAVVVALAAAGVAGITRATGGASSGSKSAAARQGSGFVKVSSRTIAWTEKQRALGAAPQGLRWSTSASSGSSSTKGTARTATPSRATVPATYCAAAGCSVSSPVYAVPLTRQFVRTAGDVTVRAFTEALSVSRVEPLLPPKSGVSLKATVVAPAAAAVRRSAPDLTPATGSTGSSGVSGASGASGVTGASGATGVTITPVISCEPTEALLVEVSNPGAVGEITVSLPGDAAASAAQPFELIDSSVVGVAESSPIEVITVHVAPVVSSVQASFADGSSDEMTVSDGWAVLVDDGSAPLPADLTAFDSSGASVGTASVSSDDALAEPEQCLGLPVAPNTASPGSTAATTAK